MNYQDLPAPMHPRYSEFLSFMADCPHRKTPETMQTAFWAWLETNESQEWFAARPDPRDEQIIALKTDLDRIHRERENFHIQCSAQAEEIKRLETELSMHKRDLINPEDAMIKILQEENKDLRGKLDDVMLILLGGAVGERGKACMSIDGGNL